MRNTVLCLLLQRLKRVAFSIRLVDVDYFIYLNQYVDFQVRFLYCSVDCCVSFTETLVFAKQ